MNKETNLIIETIKEKDKELKYKLISENKKLITGIGHIALIESIEKLNEVRREIKDQADLINELGNDGNEIINLYRKLENRVKNIDIVLNSDFIDDSLGVDYFRGLRNEAYNLLTGITDYITEVSYANEISNDKIAKMDFQKNNRYKDKYIKFDKFYEDVYNFLTEDMDAIFHKISRILSVLPLRISKIKYYDVVRETLSVDLKNYNKRKIDIVIQRYKAIFNGSMSIGYGQKFDKYFTQSQRFKRVDYINSTEEQLSIICKETKELLTDMHTVLNIIRECGLIINRLIILSTIRETLDINGTDSFNEILNKWSLWRDQDDITSIDSILNLSKKSKKEIDKEIHESNKTLHSIYEIYPLEGFDEELSNVFARTKNMMSLLNDEYLEREEMLTDVYEGENDDLYLEQIINNFIQFLDRNIRNMSNIQRKVRMRRLLSIIVPFKKPDTFFDYLRNSIELNNSNENISFILFRIAGIIEEYANDINQ